MGSTTEGFHLLRTGLWRKVQVGSGGQWAEHGETPEEAITNTLRVAREYVAQVNEMIAPFEESEMTESDEMQCVFCGAALDETEKMYTLKEAGDQSEAKTYVCESCMQKQFKKVEKH